MKLKHFRNLIDLHRPESIAVAPLLSTLDIECGQIYLIHKSNSVIVSVDVSAKEPDDRTYSTTPTDHFLSAIDEHSTPEFYTLHFATVSTPALSADSYLKFEHHPIFTYYVNSEALTIILLPRITDESIINTLPQRSFDKLTKALDLLIANDLEPIDYNSVVKSEIEGFFS